MNLPRLQSLIAKKPEQKISAIIASVATLLVIISAVWITFTKQEPEKLEKPKVESVIVTQKPVISRTPQQQKEKEEPKIQPELVVAPPPKEKVQNEYPAPQSSAPVKPIKKTPVDSKKYYIQVGAFKNYKHADMLLDKMRTKYKHAEIMTKNDLYLVWVGPFSSNTEATKQQQIILKNDKIKGFTKTKP